MLSVCSGLDAYTCNVRARARDRLEDCGSGKSAVKLNLDFSKLFIIVMAAWRRHLKPHPPPSCNNEGVSPQLAAHGRRITFDGCVCDRSWVQRTRNRVYNDHMRIGGAFTDHRHVRHYYLCNCQVFIRLLIRSTRQTVNWQWFEFLPRKHQ